MKANGTRWGWQNPRFAASGWQIPRFGTSGLQIRWSGAMKTNVVFFTIMMLGLIGCNPVHKRQSSVVSNDSTNINMISIETNLKDTTAFRPVLLHEITSFIDKYKDYGPIIILMAERKQNDCCIFMSTSYFYDTRFIIGYQIIDEKMVAYYYNYIQEGMSYYEFISALDTIGKDELLSENGCMDALIDKSKLKTDRPQSFLDENSEFAMYTDYDPVGRRYIIHSPDSLELVFEGYY